MSVKIALSVTLITLMVSGCATFNSSAAKSGDQSLVEGQASTDDATDADNLEATPRPEIVANLPKNIESFEMAGAQAFDAEGEGVTVRYANPRKHRRADVFVYPVSENNRNLEHPELVMGSTQATMRAIAQAVQEGVYQNLNVIDAATKAKGLRTVARVQATYLRQNLASYTLVYQTEHDGTMVKIRVTMPDNEPNRASREWDRFADVVLQAVTQQLDIENAAQPANDKTAAL